ncbi:hypothetical protein D4764_16G0001780 [Takifugu flavidus]|uniref:Reverse transcriptase domain-containing protein n=1 Tax=Takifugu flavidus TaxID=433684 RepID=A0A5C6NYH6_9TELE|nr:hypothetical protein D4764_16G0001780 [Takifugu flavidus]
MPCSERHNLSIAPQQQRITYGVSGPLIRAVRSLYDRCQSLFCIAGNDVVLLASSPCDLQLSLDRFAATCEAAGMKISTSKSEAMVLNQKKVECLLQVKEEILPQVEEYLRVLFTSEGSMEQEIDRRPVPGRLFSSCEAENT